MKTADAPKFNDEIFGEAGIDVNHWANLLKLPGHPNRSHAAEYHQYVYNVLKGRLDAAVAAGVVKDLLWEVLANALLDLAEELCSKRGPAWQILMK